MWLKKLLAPSFGPAQFWMPQPFREQTSRWWKLSLCLCLPSLYLWFLSEINKLFKSSFSFSWKGRIIKREIERNMFQPLFYSPNVHNGWGWANRKPGACSRSSCGCRVHQLGLSPAAFPEQAKLKLSWYRKFSLC